MLFLGIETSCDETSAAVVRNGREVLSNAIASQILLHRLTGGVVPEVAAREHIVTILPIIEQALADAGLTFAEIEAIAVTEQPGLIASLLVGINTARTMAMLGEKKLIPVNHIEGHIYANWLDHNEEIRFPIVVLTVSGGHNELILMKGYGEFKPIGSTRDDAAGEAFDKVARLLGLPYPGGPEIANLAFKGNPKAYSLPRALAKEGYDFSFSGLKSAVARLVAEEGNNLRRVDLAASFQEAVCDVLSAKLIRVALEYRVKEVHLAGGVSANLRLRELVKERLSQTLPAVKLRYPRKLSYCTDSAAMIAAAGYFYDLKASHCSDSS
ncbi:MAG: metalloendopeptidase, glycoprotease family, O-sialoglycoprotein endopeptidase [Candidatus Peregrinibacteria bacterium GW2011_GWE2_39_6]|nr:MAG: metalloendopeptidase, glycoprotease family, O-sialoglycoprotein endopeptidase [Candidatus Peregrinibacteria bacterium GW2011_GWF2_39_17]KKR26347.1 MAG: metalloendopeptidase, glycoprotease family, O-sialoglycoprotein endopeptidase [Candidatus Peregrinibacteria bacterium GW2011_GWE2_39_6]HCW32824.1 tRNA (adenosine(37)-N6)-threonylcarbamoyltransferase complex transferase subunit TsaD [Candidatus Peregrinibacteria bacterium]